MVSEEDWVGNDGMPREMQEREVKKVDGGDNDGDSNNGKGTCPNAENNNRKDGERDAAKEEHGGNDAYANEGPWKTELSRDG